MSTFLGLFPTCWVHAEFQFSLPLNGMQLSGKVLREFPVLQSRIHRNALLMNRSPWQHGRGSEDWLSSAAYRAPATSSSHLSHAARLPHLQTFQLHVVSFIWNALVSVSKHPAPHKFHHIGLNAPILQHWNYITHIKYVLQETVKNGKSAFKKSNLLRKTFNWRKWWWWCIYMESLSNIHKAPSLGPWTHIKWGGNTHL